jgi:hypothetical protein
VNYGNLNNGTIRNETIINNITINGLGNEDIRYLTEAPEYKRLMSDCIKNDIAGVCEFMVKKHLDKEHPENRNLRKMNRNDGFIEYHDGNNWKVSLFDNVLDDVFEQLKKHFVEFVDEFACESHVLRKDWIDKFMKRVGEPLEWDLTSGRYDYDFDEDMTDEDKFKLKTRIFKVACDYIYRHSRKM